MNTINMAAPFMGEEEINAVTEVLKSGHIAHGAVVEEFEKDFADYIGVKHAIACSNGTTALFLALLAHGIGQGDEVITTPFSFVATANAILMTGATPVFVDIDNEFNLNPLIVEDYITSRTKAIIPVHLYGNPCRMNLFLEIAENHNLVLIEDCAQAHGAIYKHMDIQGRVGSFGTGCFSFYPTKNMTTGEGGMVTTNDNSVAEKAKILRNHGQTKRYNSSMLGYNFRMTNIAAAIGNAQLSKLDALNNLRRLNAHMYIDGLCRNKGVILPRLYYGPETIGTHAYHQFTIRANKRDELREYLKEHKINTETYYPILIPQQDYYRQFFSQKYVERHFPLGLKMCEQVLSLPVHPRLETAEVVYVIEKINEFYGR